jgi:hypothetical protein
MSTHGVHVGAHIVRNKKRVRGYPHVALPPDRAPKDDDQPDDQEDCSQGA